jgi:type 1 glutamine amidotransferase
MAVRARERLDATTGGWIFGSVAIALSGIAACGCGSSISAGGAADASSSSGATVDATTQDAPASADVQSPPPDVGAAPSPDAQGLPGAQGAPDAQEASAGFDAGPAAADSGPQSKKILIYAVTQPAGAYRHASIPDAANAIAAALGGLGLTTEAVGTTDATNVVDATKFTAESLAQYGAVILLSDDGEPFGYPATQEIQNLVDYVQQGGALVAAHCTTDSYGGGYSGPILNHPASVPFHTLLGATMVDHSNLGPATCKTVGSHVSVAKLPVTFNTTEEIYNFSGFAADNQVVMTCISDQNPQVVRSVAWYREVGAGRYFYTSLGHTSQVWMMPMDPAQPSSLLLQNHFIPGLFWAMKR